ncbi:small basic protein [Candidatus Similichlamydia laticola]|uniref:small basic protein n=1 Tax=Candidatus Similichlamydia laticola TaxID=2170265 RepID=UPI000DF85AC2|nr:small basic protein [Candidatus Similichlamydia laticola]
MSKHRSYGRKGRSSQKRSVLTRWERVAVLRKLGRWDDKINKTVTGLPKTPLVSID